MLTFEAELLLGVLGAGLPGAGEGLDRVDLGSACGGLGVALAGGVDADVVVLGAGVGFGLPCPAGLRAGVLAGLSGFGERGVRSPRVASRSLLAWAMAASACCRIPVIWASA